MEESKNILATTYQPQDVEQKWYKFWLDNGCFSSEIIRKGNPSVLLCRRPM